MKKTILFIVPEMFGPPGGIARYCRMVCQALVAAGFDLQVVALLDAAGSLPPDEPLWHKLKYISCSQSRIQFIYKTLLNAVVKPTDFVLVGHVNFTPLGWCAAQLSQSPMITSVHGIDVWAKLPFLRRWALKRSRLILAVSDYTVRRAIAANHISREKTRVLPNCLDPNFENQIQAKPNTKTKLLTVGRLSQSEKYKGHDYVLRALPSLISHYPDLVYNIVGDGDWRSELEDLASKLNILERVHFLRWVSETELQQLYRDSTLFIMPSRGEGFGIVFLEAMAQGLVVIGGNMDATPEVIVNGQTGILVNPLSVDEIVDAAHRILGDPMLHQRMANAAIEHVKSNFGFAKFQATLLQHLAEL